jgi:PAS domain S-box-containing protein
MINLENISIKRDSPVIKILLEALNNIAFISISNTEGTITQVNKLFCDISQYSETELVGQSHNIINSGYHDKKFWANFWDTIKNGTCWSGEIKNKAKDGTFYWVECHIYPIENINGQIESYLAVRYNITDKKEKEFNSLKHQHNLKAMLNSVTDAHI